MALPDISLAQFNKIASGDYNAGQIDFKTNARGETELVKINNHVWKESKNNVVLSPERILEVKEMFLNALQKGGVTPEKMAEVRNRLGLPADLDVPATKAQRDDLIKARFTPLSRAEVREILDTYANQGRGFTWESKNDISYENWAAGQATAAKTGRSVRWRDNVNEANKSLYGKNDNFDFKMNDAIALLSTTRPLDDLDGARSRRITGENAVNKRLSQHTALVNTFQGLASVALSLLPATKRESGEFQLAGTTVNIVKGDDGKLTAIIGKGNLATNVSLKIDADTFVRSVLGRAVVDAETLGATALKNTLNTVYNRDLETGLVASEKTSLTRQFAALVLSNKSGGKVDMGMLIAGNYNTGILVEMAQRAIEGEDVGDCKAKLDAYHAKLVSDNSNLSPEMKAMFENVANMPLEIPQDNNEGLIVRDPIVGDINQVVQAMPQPVQVEVPKNLNDIGGLDAVKNFVADLVFSDNTMLGDVVATMPGETMRKFLTDSKNLVAFTAILKDPNIIKSACSDQIADTVMDGLGKIEDIIAAEFKRATGKDFNVAKTEDDFDAQFAAFLKDPEKMRGAELVKFDEKILAMANKGCQNIQLFINDVFKVDNLKVNDQGGIVGDPYKNTSAADIKTALQGKSLNQILDTASNADSPGQVGFFRQVISKYFTSLDNADKRSCFAAAMRYASTFDFTGLEDADLVSAQQAALNKFTGAILKGTSPLLQKMMQGLPKDVMGAYADALEDMKCNLAPIPRKIVQAHFMQLINDTRNTAHEIESIELKKSLGAASVGEAFLCEVKVKGEEKPREVVIKIMRHDAERRVKAEAEIFTEAAEKIGPGMAKTWEGQLKQYMTEFDFRTEAENVNTGVGLYDIKDNEDHALQAIGSNVKSMKMSDITVAKKDIMVAEVASGTTVDKYFKENIAGIRKAASSVFEQDPATGRIKWVEGPIDPKTNKPKMVPVVKQNLPGGAIPNMIDFCRDNYAKIKSSQQKLVQATKVWFHEAIFGSGKFHGDTHSGNLMVSGSAITFIDFGNLYTLRQREDGVDERHELLRVIMGATFRDSKFVMEGFRKLLSESGKASFDANKAKVEAILDAVLSKGRFSYDIVYRLNAIVTELQKLGLELPPQINCFVQSMARLSNTMAEMNTIINQTSALLDAADGYIRQGPAPQRDELDVLGMALDYRASTEGQDRVDDDQGFVGLQKNGKPVKISSYFHHLRAEGFGGFTFDEDDETLEPGGDYYNRVAQRIGGSNDSVGEARSLTEMLKNNADAEHNETIKIYVELLDEKFIEFQNAMQAATTPEAKTSAVDAYTKQYCNLLHKILEAMRSTEENLVSMRTFESVEKPSSFANAIMTTLMDNYDTLEDTFESSKTRLRADAFSITNNELGAKLWYGPQARINLMKEDSRKMAGDDSYQIDIGV